MGFPHGTCTAPPRQSDDCHARWHRRRPTCREAGPLSVPTGHREVHSGSCVSLLQSRLCMIHINFCSGRLFLLYIIPARTRVTCALAVIDDTPSTSTESVGSDTMGAVRGFRYCCRLGRAIGPQDERGAPAKEPDQQPTSIGPAAIPTPPAA